jgi:hypothetical protein
MAEWRPTPGQHVQLHGLKAKQHNDTHGIVVGSEASPEAAECWAAAERVPLRRGDQKKLLCIKAENLREPVFVVQPVPGKGMGVIAARNIAKGERLLLDPPLFSIASRSGAAVDLRDALAELSQEQLEAFSELTACSNYLSAGMPKLRAIMATNALPLGCLSGTEDKGLFLVASRFNHSCQPNVVHCWNPNLKGETMHARGRTTRTRAARSRASTGMRGYGSSLRTMRTSSRKARMGSKRRSALRSSSAH